MKKRILSRILQEKVVVIVRLKDGNVISRVIDHLVLGGIQVLEVTSNTPNFHIGIREARKKHPKILVGAGTITTVELAQKAISSGAQFLVTPNTNKTVVKEAVKAKIPIIMGAFTPTEVTNAISFGADIIKLFPAGQLGVSYFKSLKAPFSNSRFFAVGGINTENIKNWFDVGVDGLGIGGSLVNSEIKSQEEFEGITTRANRLMALIRNYETSANKENRTV